MRPFTPSHTLIYPHLFDNHHQSNCIGRFWPLASGLPPLALSHSPIDRPIDRHQRPTATQRRSDATRRDFERLWKTLKDFWKTMVVKKRAKREASRERRVKDKNKDKNKDNGEVAGSLKKTKKTKKVQYSTLSVWAELSLAVHPGEYVLRSVPPFLAVLFNSCLCSSFTNSWFSWFSSGLWGICRFRVAACWIRQLFQSCMHVFPLFVNRFLYLPRSHLSPYSLIALIEGSAEAGWGRSMDRPIGLGGVPHWH